MSASDPDGSRYLGWRAQAGWKSAGFAMRSGAHGGRKRTNTCRLQSIDLGLRSAKRARSKPYRRRPASGAIRHRSSCRRRLLRRRARRNADTKKIALFRDWLLRSVEEQAGARKPRHDAVRPRQAAGRVYKQTGAIKAHAS